MILQSAYSDLRSSNHNDHAPETNHPGATVKVKEGRNMELTRDKIEWLAKQPVITKYSSIETVELIDIAKQLLAEMDNPKVWDNAPQDATFASIHYAIESGHPYPEGTHERAARFHYRELPKSPEREIAEKWANTPTTEPTRKYLADTIEAAIKEALEKVK